MFKKITVLIITLLLFSFCVINSFAEGEPDDTGTPAETEETGSEIPPHDHDPVLVPGSEPFCETTGVKPHFACSICGEMWADPGMTEPLTESDVIIPALGHDWGEWITVKPATATEPGEYRRYCKRTPDQKILYMTLDAGHGPYDNQGYDKAYYEGRRMYTLMTFLVEELNKYSNVVIYQTRYDMMDAPALGTRGTTAAENGSELFISLHSNWYETTKAAGVSVYYSFMRPESVELGRRLGLAVTNVMNEVTGVTFMRNDDMPMTRTEPAEEPFYGDGVTQDYYNVLRKSTMSDKCRYTYIIEHGFHSNPEECRFLMSDDNLKKVAKAEADVIAEYFDLHTLAGVPDPDRHVEYNITPPVGSPDLPIQYDVPENFTVDATGAFPGGVTVSVKPRGDLSVENRETAAAFELDGGIGEWRFEPEKSISVSYKTDDPDRLSGLRAAVMTEYGFLNVPYETDTENMTVSFSANALGEYIIYLCDESLDLFGDINGDGATNNKDVAILFRYVSGDGGPAVKNRTAADTNLDGAVNNKDIVRLFNYLSGRE